VSGTVTGLLAGAQVTLQNNGADDLTVSDNTSFTFNTPVAFGSSYLVSIGTQPLNQLCTVQNGTGSGVQANVSNVAIVCGPAPGFSVFYEFGSNGSSVDGFLPNAGLVQGADGNFYGTTYHGGAYSNVVAVETEGTVFKITPSGTESILYSFGATGSTDGALPESSLVIGNDGNFYGTTLFGGTCCADVSGAGTIFSLTPGGVETQLYSFPSLQNQAMGIYPDAGLILGSDGNFYGTASQGGNFCTIDGCFGVVFKMTPSGSFSILYTFGTNGGANDAAYPFSSLLQGSNGNFYGTTISGGLYNNGAVFMITPGGVESVLYSFGAAGTADGASPRSNLIQDSAGNLYGTTFSGGVNNQGTVFKISPTGSASILYSFGGSPNDGGHPNGALLLASDGYLYGSTMAGGVNNDGTIYQLSTTGSEKVLHSFTGSDGSFPYGQLIQARDGNLYGVTQYGGYLGNGTVFKFAL
jgi:uncharacterized repeat protein (TIGR03803 family)